MKIFTIKTKITLWYTFFMVVLVSAMLGIIIEFTDSTMFSNQKKQLIETVEDAVEDIYEGDSIEYFEDGIYILKYDDMKEYLGGSIPERFPLDFPFKQGQIQKIGEGKERFYVYDQKISFGSGKNFWIRGVAEDIYADEIVKIIIGGAFFFLPFLVIFSSAVGYFITKRAFEPVKKIQETAQEITEGKNLSLRIGLPEGKDEISKLGKTIDNMLERVEKSFEQEKQFTSDASHELRTPVAVILAETEYILKHGEDISEAKESMEVINRQAEKMSALINQLLFFTRAEQGRIELNFEETDIGSLVQENIDELKIFAEEKNISLKLENNLNFDFKCSVDKIMFSRAVQNVIKNSIVYGRENGHTAVRVFEKDNFTAVEVKDDGIGISDKHIKKIWDRFYQADEARTNRKQNGMGLGLSMVKWIVEKHGGYVEVKSVLEEGSVFILYFPKNL